MQSNICMQIQEVDEVGNVDRRAEYFLFRELTFVLLSLIHSL